MPGAEPRARAINEAFNGAQAPCNGEPYRRGEKFLARRHDLGA
jgi:hypothetical protein